MVNVLIVEDNYDLQMLFATVFKRAGYEVTVASDGYEACHYLLHELPQVMILDINIPGPSGLDIARFVRESEQEGHVIMIVVTANHAAKYADEIKFVDMFLEKPVYPTELTVLAKRLLDDK